MLIKSLRSLTDVLGRISPEHYVTIKSPLINHKFLIYISLSLITSRLKVRDLRDQTRMLPEVQLQPTSKPLPQFWHHISAPGRYESILLRGKSAYN